ncbi:MAG: NADH-quinone oxidoreductase subunit A [Candidatus Thermoplasmatota archaeon]|uniref:NADH-quinone oxidoreductase subunit A n=1 Tax=Ferroplasma sp. TaxID=2591003 RepID=UPI002604C9FE|nr:NADH-quinone oxidoreductase subunit A [Ferroplasma sp.]MCL4312348.1 NADH-quinone oxidoreductase subunit A [Candidatus Thermoplasmatota archaeon]
MMLGYASIVITIIIMVLALYLLFKILPTVGANRYKKGGIKFSRKEISENISLQDHPPASDDSYLQPYESGEVAVEYEEGHITVQYYVIIFLFILFDIDMLLLFPWAFDFYALGAVPFFETIVFLAMPLFAVFYAYKKGYMRWMK